MSEYQGDVLARLRAIKQCGDIDAARELLTEWYTGSGSRADEWQAFSILYTFALSEARLAEAHEFASHLVAMDEADPFAHSCLGQVYRLRGDLGNAEIESGRALELAERTEDPGLLSYFVDMGRVLLDVGDLTRCERLLARAKSVGLNTANDELSRIGWLRLLASFHRAQGDSTQALQLLRSAMRATLALRTPLPCYDVLLRELVDAASAAEETHRRD